MFGKKRATTTPTEPPVTAHIQTIPDVFYAGNDPMIYHPTTQKKATADTPPMKNAPVKPLMSPKVPQGGAVSRAPSRRWIIILGIVLFLLVASVVTWYFIAQAKKQIENAPQVPETIMPDLPALPETPVIAVPTSTATDVVSSTESVAPTSTLSLDTPIQFPSTFLIDTPDFDADQLTDQEEELFRTDGSIWDTDGDGYYDGQEVFNLYNPAGTAPEKIIDSGLVREFINPTLAYRVYYPVGWEAGVVDTGGRQVLFSSITGDYVEVRAIDRIANESFSTWFARHAGQEQFSLVQEITNRFQESVYQRADGLVAYVVQPEVVFVLVYHPSANASSIPFRNVVKMMIQSFRPSRSPGSLPTQTVLPTPGSTESVTEVPTTTTNEAPESSVVTSTSEQAEQGG